jgi:hypothetical protein
MNYLKLGGSGGSFVQKGQPVYTHLITSDDIIAKQVQLDFIPQDSTLVLLDNVSKQNLGRDYILNGNILSWANLELDGFVEAGESLFLYY